MGEGMLVGDPVAIASPSCSPMPRTAVKTGKKAVLEDADEVQTVALPLSTVVLELCNPELDSVLSGRE
jgi:hypothetical protein